MLAHTGASTQAAAMLLGELTVVVAELGDGCLLDDCGAVHHNATCLQEVLQETQGDTDDTTRHCMLAAAATA